MLKGYAENWDNYYFLPKTKTPKGKQSEKTRRAQMGLPSLPVSSDPMD
ncbi:MAG: hypothetical protein ACLR0U_07145 [Enterocloster clostridioformis]